MKAVRFLLAVALAVLGCAAACPAAAAEGGKSRVVALSSSRLPIYEEVVQGFKETLAESGRPARVETVVLSDDHAATVRALRGADLVFALGGGALRAAAEAGVDLPVVAGMVTREKDLRGEGENVTGVFLQHPLATQFRHLRTFLPSARKVAVLYSTGENHDYIERAVGEAASEGFELIPYKINVPGDIPGALESISRQADVLWGIPDRIVLNSSTAKETLLFSFRNRIPLIGLSPNWVKSGALYALGWDYRDIGAQCGTMAAAVLGGRRAGAIPPKAPREVVYTLNRKTLERMKLKLPEAILRDASEIY